MEKELDQQVSKYKATLSEVLIHIREWNWNDPVSLLLCTTLFKPEVIFEPEISKQDLQTDLKRRQRFKCLRATKMPRKMMRSWRHPYMAHNS